MSLTLLIVFVLYPGSPRHGMAFADLPLTSYASPQFKAIREDAIRITISRDGSFFFRGMKVGGEDLPNLIQKAVQEGSERKVYLTVDARAKCADVEPVLDQVRAAGIKETTFLADQRLPR